MLNDDTVYVGKYAITLQPDGTTVWIGTKEGEGGAFSLEAFEQSMVEAVEKFYLDKF